MTPLNKLVSILAPIMGKDVDDPEVLKAAVDVVMAIRTPDRKMREAGSELVPDVDGHWQPLWAERIASNVWKAMIDALLTEGG